MSKVLICDNYDAALESIKNGECQFAVFPFMELVEITHFMVETDKLSLMEEKISPLIPEEIKKMKGFGHGNLCVVGDISIDTYVVGVSKQELAEAIEQFAK